ncbi:MAG: BatA domain-containing protein [Planctomycetes bacterium]|nr:BatA domain-containing protein [Planctomycetota bacterium]
MVGALALVALPVLIHLINMLRQRRVPWAAMEFLLQSQKKYSRWVRIKELLLLLARMSIVALAVLVIAQPLWSGAWNWRLTDRPLDHVILLDDSFSMTDRGADRDAFDVARQTVERLVRQWAARGGSQKVSLLRYSRAGDERSSPQFDLLELTIDNQLADQLHGRMQAWRPTDMALQPGPVVGALGRALPVEPGTQRVVYIVSDFRATPWGEPGELATQLAKMSADGTRFQLVQCVDQQRENLAVVALEPAIGTRAAGVSLNVNVTVQNFGRQLQREVALEVEQDGVASNVVRFDALRPGEQKTAQFQIVLSDPGSRTVQVSLPSDAVAVDNHRACVIETAASVPVLIVPGESQSLDARFLATLFHPGGTARTGLDVTIETPNFLGRQALDKFSTIYLLDVPRLDEGAVRALEEFVRGGGGVTFFLGPHTLIDFYNRALYRDGNGLFPLPLAAEMPLLADRLEHAPDIDPTDHPIFREQLRRRNNDLATVLVERFIMAPTGWQPATNASVIAKLRNGSPLVVERSFGRGRVVAFTSTAAPLWNSWARNLSFVVTMLELQSYLSASSQAPTSQLVGAPITLRVDAGKYQAQGRWVRPGDGPASAVDLKPEGNDLVASLTDANDVGIYQLHLATQTGQPVVRRFALNADPRESDLRLVEPAQIAEQFPDVRLEFRRAVDIGETGTESRGTNFSDLCLYLLIVLLVGEQGLARAASYHLGQPATGGRV